MTGGLVTPLFVISLLVGSPGTVLFLVDPLVATGVGVVAGSITTVFGIAITTRAYVQLNGHSLSQSDSTPPTDPTDSAAVTESL